MIHSLTICDLDDIDQIELAELIAHIVHKGQFRRDGQTPYVEHPEAVCDLLYDLVYDYGFTEAEIDEACAVALLHDVLEDATCVDFTYKTLLALGVSSNIVVAVVLLTKTKEESYQRYLEQMCSNKLALIVKIADITHNLSDSPKALTVPRYQKALVFLKEKLSALQLA